MALNLNAIHGKLTAVSNRVLVTDMNFGEQVTSSGIVVKSDNGTTRGIYPRWAKVYGKGPNNKDEYEIGQWILIEHGRWTRSFLINDGDGEKEVRMVEAESILCYADEKPNDIAIGAEYADGAHATIDPSSFVNPN
jgi:hypothetical protein